MTPDTYWDLFAAYTAIWIFIVAYLVKLTREQRRLARLINELESGRR